VATLQVELESAEGRLSLGETIDLLHYATLANCLRRLLETVGIERVAKTIDHGPLHDAFAKPVRRDRGRDAL
jgi:hypothetical protein